jgi:hypothetical protein
LLGVAFALGSLPVAAESLQYQVLYKGLLSAGAELPIADLTLKSRKPATDASYRESELSASSQAYDYVENFYPIRYRFRSWYQQDLSNGVAFEYHRQKRNSKIKHRLVYLDNPHKPFVTHNLVTEGELDLPALLNGSYRRVSEVSGGVRFDRLGLLAYVRAQALDTGRVLEVPVSNGKTMMKYRVSVEAREAVRALGQTWQTLKLRFDGLKLDKRGREKHTHRPVFIWLSDDAWRLPLRAVNRHALGIFLIELKQVADAGARLAQLPGDQ